MDARFPAAFESLFQPARYKIFYGGRGSGKSMSVARALLLLAAQQPLRVLCARELQVSIRDSVHKLLSDQIDALGLADFYEITQTTIRGANGSEFVFKGLRHNISEVKGLQGVNICWIEEGQTVSKASYEILIPTIREEKSEIWVTFNPELDSDETYQRFVVNPPPNALVRKVNYTENPFFPEVLKEEMEALKEANFQSYLTVWEGHCRQVLDGAIYSQEILAATSAGRITRVPYERAKPVHTFFDLGKRDLTSIWFAQIVAFEFRVIDFYEHRGVGLDHYMRVMQERGYIYGDCWLPHDAEHDRLGMPQTIARQMMDAGFKVRITPKIRMADGISAVRVMFPNLWFDAEKCAVGLNRLKRYRYDVDANGQYSREPLHSDESNAADALRYLAVALREQSQPRPIVIPKPVFVRREAGSWMR